MDTNAVMDAVDSLFALCITSRDSSKAFGKAASRVRRLALSNEHERRHFSHLALAFEEQQRLLESLQRSQLAKARDHATKRDRELAAFCTAQQELCREFLRF